jgi:hypothetical protein
VIIEVQQNQEQSKNTKNKKQTQDDHKLENSEMRACSNGNDETADAPLPENLRRREIQMNGNSQK